MVLREINGKYSQAGIWWDPHGKSGTLDGSITIEFSGERLGFRYGDGEIQTSELLTGVAQSAAIGGQNSVGTVFIGENCLILEYMAEVNGLEEMNTDTWMFLGGTTHRSGLIRQGERIIWFEAEMSLG